MLFQGDSITDAGRDKGDGNNLGNGSPKYAANSVDGVHPTAKGTEYIGKLYVDYISELI